MNKSIIFIVVSFLLLAGCFWRAEGEGVKDSAGVEVLLQGNDSAIQEPRNVVVKSQKGFDALWEECQKDNPVAPKKPVVDFKKKWVIACFAGWVPTAGHSLEVKSLKAGAAVTLITIVHKQPGRDCVTAQVIEFPYVIVAVDHFSPERAEFRTIIEETPCR